MRGHRKEELQVPEGVGDYILCLSLPPMGAGTAEVVSRLGLFYWMSELLNKAIWCRPSAGLF